MKRSFDSSQFPKIEYAHAWFRLEDAALARLNPLSRASDRLKNAIRFMWFSASDQKTLGVDADSTVPLREGFLRAALSELVSIEGILYLDLRDLSRREAIFKMNDTALPHLHFVRELRNHELHLRHSTLNEFSRDLLWGNLAKPDDASPLTISFWRLDGVTRESFGKLDSAKYYTAGTVAAMVDWFNAAQGGWGVHEILLRAAKDYADALGNHYFPQ